MGSNPTPSVFLLLITPRQSTKNARPIGRAFFIGTNSANYFFFAGAVAGFVAGAVAAGFVAAGFAAVVFATAAGLVESAFVVSCAVFAFVLACVAVFAGCCAAAGFVCAPATAAAVKRKAVIEAMRETLRFMACTL
jgi:hypothetical protein